MKITNQDITTAARNNDITKLGGVIRTDRVFT